MLVPKFRVLSEEEKKTVLEKFRTTSDKLPKIMEADSIAANIGAKRGNLLEITRSSEVAGQHIYYRIVV